MKDFTHRLARLRGIAHEKVLAVEYKQPTTDTIYSVGTSVRFADGTKLDAQFWRLTKAGRPLVSIFDHRQRSEGRCRGLRSRDALALRATCPEVEFEEDEIGARLDRRAVVTLVGRNRVGSETPDGPSLAALEEVPPIARALVVGIHGPLSHDVRAAYEVLGEGRYASGDSAMRSRTLSTAAANR